jgi:dimethylhistidine N-methyltransferase
MSRAGQQPTSSEHQDVLRDVLEGLSRPQKALPGKYLWDETGSVLFDRICNTEDYYLTRREIALLKSKANEIARLIGPGATIVEFGSGASHKVRILLDALVTPRRYVAIDISQEFLEAATRRIAQDYPHIEVVPICADYTKPLRLPAHLLTGRVLGFFPGSTIGNFDPEGVVAFLRRARATLGPSWFLMGADPNHEEQSLLRAYGRADGLMAALHKNLLRHLNHLIGTSFGPDDFRHEAYVRADPPRVEAYLVALRPLRYEIGDQIISIEAGEHIHTDNSYKHQPEDFRRLADQAGWTLMRCWLDPQGLFSLHLLRP